MNWEAIGAIGEVVGAIGVIASLLYLALQIRGDAKAKRASAVHDQTDAYRDFLKTMATDGELSAIYMRGINDFSSVEGADLVRFGSALGFLFRIFDEAYYHWSEGNLETHVWRGFEAPIVDMLAYPGVRSWWSTRSHWYSTKFQAFVSNRESDISAPSLYGESAS